MEQDDDERHNRHVLGKLGVVEMDEGEPVVGHHHPKGEEEHQSGEPISVSDAADHDADDDEGSAEEDSCVNGEAAVHLTQ